MPCYAQALNRVLDMQLGYAICRVDNGAAGFLAKMGAVAESENQVASYYGGEVCLMSFRPSELNPRFTSLVAAAVDRLVDSSKIYLGSMGRVDLSQEKWWRTESIPIGGMRMATRSMGAGCVMPI